ncbi:potassium channel family protein [Desulforhopalus singaporensis]|uniref:Voltage-gated potassium channel n=1 Tax=Desulforhopalus singaporensis TaxID=91360 RepID=A0A1H0LWL8_9BACT|nr:potassium channel family protein [Desulforhopalus singaporensis]SDO72493.1 voltage-gated potassium channel [Desulforhopalus singaporensis]
MNKRLKKIIEFLNRENLLTLLLIILVIVLCSSLAITYFEPDISFVSGIWWSIVTLTTVGYGDISPTSGGGRAVAAIIMFFGIGLLGMLSAQLATVMISKRMSENKGMGTVNLEEHVILCEWNHRSSAVLKEVRADRKTRKVPVVLIADIDEKPVDDPLLIFVRGTVNEETLEKARLKNAATVVILGDDNVDPTARDAKVVLTTLTVESINPEVYTIVELVNKANEQHCRRARADEIIVGSELSSHLLATAAIDHGMSAIVSELLSTRYGNDLFSVAAPRKFVGRKYLEVMIALKQDHQATLLGIQNKKENRLLANPEMDYVIADEDYLVMISRDRSLLPS